MPFIGRAEVEYDDAGNPTAIMARDSKGGKLPLVTDAGIGSPAGTTNAVPAVGQLAIGKATASELWMLCAAQVIRAGSGWCSAGVGFGSKLIFDHQANSFALVTTGKAASGSFAIGVFYSDDFINWTAYGSNPVFSGAASAGWDYGGVGTPDVYWDGTQWHMFYEGFRDIGYEAGPSSIGHATAPALTGPWTRDAANPVIPNSAFTWIGASGAMYKPMLSLESGRYYIHFNGGFVPGQESLGHSYASSLNGPWTHVAAQDILYTAYGNGNGIIADPVIYRVGDVWHLLTWDSAQSNATRLWTASTLAGPWTLRTTPVVFSGSADIPIRHTIISTGSGLVMMAQGGSLYMNVYVPAEQSVRSLKENIREVRRRFDAGNSWGTVDLTSADRRRMYFAIDPTGQYPNIGTASGNAGSETERTLFGFNVLSSAAMYGLGGITNAFPGARRSGVTYEFRLADDSDYCDVRTRFLTQRLPASADPASNLDFLIQATSNTSLSLKYRGSDGVVRAAVLTLT